MKHRLLLVLCAGVAVGAGTVSLFALRATRAATRGAAASDGPAVLAVLKRSGYIVASS
jgi:hypothetical protein